MASVRTLLLVAAGVVCATPARASSPPSQIVLVGDSITAGYGASSFTTVYSNDLAQLCGSGTTVAPFGHPGATMISTSTSPYVPYIQQNEYASATAQVTGAAASAMVAVVIMLGTNDSAAQNWFPADGGDGRAQFIADYEAMIDHFEGLSPRPAVYVTFPPAVYNTSAAGANDCTLRYDVIPAIAQVAADKALPTIDVYGPTSGHPEYSADGIHPNDQGHQVIADAMYAAILGVPYAGPDAGPLGGSCDGGGTPPAPDGGGLRVDAGEVAPAGDASDGAVIEDATGTRLGLQDAGGQGDAANQERGASEEGGAVTRSSGCACVVGRADGAVRAGSWLLFGILAAGLLRRRSAAARTGAAAIHTSGR
jgi:lysophospholipase L1-like esterase